MILFILKIKFGSTLLDANLQNRLVSLCEFLRQSKWELKYRGSSDGFKGEDFHSNCNRVEPEKTLTVIKAASGNVFGAFAAQAWMKSFSFFVRNPNSFLFFLINREKKPFVSSCGESSLMYGVWANIWIIWWLSPFRYIGSDSNTSANSSSWLGQDYAHPHYGFGAARGRHILAGSHNFRVVDIKAFTKIE